MPVGSVVQACRRPGRRAISARNIAAAPLCGRPSGGRLVRELLEAQRLEIVLLCNQGEISNEVMHRVEPTSTWKTPGSRSRLDLLALG